jgi:hypothetical protein
VIPKSKLRARARLALHIRETLWAFPDAKAAAKWLRENADSIEAEAERAKRPLETFPADPIAEAF